jgi:hypothetical protein
MSRGWALTKQSWAVLRNDRSLAIFPILSSEGFSIVGFVAAAVGVGAVIMVSIISSALNGIFRVAVYLYGVTGAPIRRGRDRSGTPSSTAIDEIWRELAQAIKPFNSLHASLLRGRGNRPKAAV